MTQHSQPVRASRAHPCLECGATQWPCSYSPDRSKRWCKNVVSDRPSSHGTYLHFAGGSARPWPPLRTPPVPSVPPPRSVVLDADHRHAVNSALLELLELRSGHRHRLLDERGLSTATIDSNCYRSTPMREELPRLTAALEPLGLNGVPGFYRRHGRWRMVGMFPGIVIPTRDAWGRVVALSYRLDEPLEKAKYLWWSSDPSKRFRDGGQKYPEGTCSGTPEHYSNLPLLEDARDCLITEGSLKGQIIADLTNGPVISVAAVSTFGHDFASFLRERFPRLRSAVIAYDRDILSKPAVAMALDRLVGQLEAEMFRVRVRTWPAPSKGYDDYLLATRRSQGVAA